jgi:hypothetical protein
VRPEVRIAAERTISGRPLHRLHDNRRNRAIGATDADIDELLSASTRRHAAIVELVEDVRRNRRE